MKIESTMNLNDLAERMGDEDTDTDIVERMRDLLVDAHDGEDTADIDSDEWLAMLDQSVIHG